MTDIRVTVKPLSGTLGAQIDGVDLSGGLSNQEFVQIRDAFHRYSMIVFRDQDLTPEQHIAFAQRWGTININRFFRPVDGHPQIAEVRKEPDQQRNIGSGWHTDHSYDQVPALGSILYARIVPDFGGDTLFASMYLAYEALSDGMKDMLSGLKAVHGSEQSFGVSVASKSEGFATGRYQNADKATQQAVHPVVVTHPATGRKALYVNPEFTVRFDGWTQEESEPLLDFLYQHASQPHFTCRLSWAKGSLAMWDNRCTWHCALNDYHGQRRLMHRITIDGEPLH